MMEKIVVLTGNSGRDDNLIKCLKMLFPECDIEIRPRGTEINNPDLSSATDNADDDLLNDKLNKFMSFL